MNTNTNIDCTIEHKRAALAAFLGAENDEVHCDKYDTYSFRGEEYLVLTYDEADIAARENITDSLWAFNASFIIEHNSQIMALRQSEYIDTLRSFECCLEQLCENANGLCRALIDDMNDFVRDAIDADGRGHFLAGYDHAENESGDYFIYRTN